MNKIYQLFIWLGMMVAIVACVDDYQDANPPRPLDSPFSVLTVEKTELVGGESTPFTVRIVDAPGLIDSVGYSTTDGKGTVVFNQQSIDNARGKSEGTITGVFTAPYDAAGEFNLTIMVYDAQGEQGKTHTMTEVLTIEYSQDAPTFTVTAANPQINPGGTTTLNITIDAPGGINDVRIFANFGQVVLDTASLDAVRGQTTGVVTATYTAPSTPTTNVGPVTFTVFVEDELQGVEVRQVTDLAAPEVRIVYLQPAPVNTISGPQTSQVGGTLNYSVNINAPGVIDTVIVTAVRNGTDTPVGVLTVAAADVAALEGETSGTLPIRLLVTDFIGYVDLRVQTIDRQGRSTTTTYLIRIDPCPVNFAGSYRTLSNGESTDDCPTNNPSTAFASTATVTKVNESTFNVSDISGGLYREWYGVCYGLPRNPAGNLRFNCTNNTVSIVAFNDAFGARVTGTGTFDPTTGVITLNWTNAFGDTGTTIFTKN